jgi:hypothetical protein
MTPRDPIMNLNQETKNLALLLLHRHRRKKNKRPSKILKVTRTMKKKI